MHSTLPTAVARSLGFPLVAIAIVISVLRVHAPASRVEPRYDNSPVAGDPLADELKHCQLIASKAKDGAACEAVWAENRRRLFSDARASAVQPTRSTR